MSDKKFLNKKRFNNKHFQQRPKESFMNKSINLFQRARELYEAYSKEYDIELNSQRSNEYRWIQKMIEKGTFEDKISAISGHIKLYPRQTLKYLDIITSHLSVKNPRQYMYIMEVLKDLYLGKILNSKKYKAFIDNTLDKSKIYTNDELLNFFIDDHIHQKYFSFISNLEVKLREDNLLSMKKKILSTLQELMKSQPEREEYLLDLLIYKLGDPKSEISNVSIQLLKNLQEVHLSMSLVIIMRIHNFIKNQQLSNENGCYHAMILISQFKYYRNEDFLKYGLSMFFDLFNEYVEYEDEKYFKFLEIIIKIINSLFKTAVNLKNYDKSSLGKFFGEKINLLFKLSHSSSIKLRIQVLRLIFFIAKDNQGLISYAKKDEESEENSNDSLLDRYYKSLYELILQKEVLVSKNLKEYLKLVISSCVFDPNSTRCLAVLKRLLQTAALAEPSYICCVLIIVSHVIHNKNSLWKFIAQIKFPKNEENNTKSLFENMNKRDPKFVEESSLIELLLFNDHFHPTVAKWANEIILNYKVSSIDYEGDPLMDFSLVNFLNKFITKNPKVKNLKKKVEESKKEGEKLRFIENFSKVKDLSDELMKKKDKKQLRDIDEFADKVMEDEIEKMDVGKNDEDDFSDENIEDDDEEYEDDEEFEDDE